LDKRRKVSSGARATARKGLHRIGATALDFKKAGAGETHLRISVGDSGLLGTCVQSLSFFPPTGPAAGAMQLPMAKRWAQN
jgi:hypothetical protein